VELLATSARRPSFFAFLCVCVAVPCRLLASHSLQLAFTLYPCFCNMTDVTMDAPDPDGPSGGVITQAFSAELLRLYYTRLFPYNEMYRWLSYGNDYGSTAVKGKGGKPVGKPEYFFHREISFTLEDDIYIRYLNFRNAEDMRKEIMKKQPHKIDIGAVYTHQPSLHTMVNAQTFKPLERELVFDIDLTDYDDVGAKGADISRGMGRDCWYFMSAAVKVCDEALRKDFGFKHLLWIFSGRRGVHCWVCDASARALDDASRKAIVEYLTVITGNERSATRVPLTYPLHPSLARCAPYLEDMFIKYVAERDPETGEGQGLLGPGNEAGWDEVLGHIKDEAIGASLKEAWSKSSAKGYTAKQRWGQLKKTLVKVADERKARSSGGRLIGEDIRNLYTQAHAIVFTYVYPRLDVNVSTHRNHLLKSPWCVHPKTGRVCVPIDPDTCETWDPHTVPTVASLAVELDSFGTGGMAMETDGEVDGGNQKRVKVDDVSKTSLKPYMHFFEEKFLAPLYSEIRSEFREEQMDARDANAAETGQW
jgi:DNA primase small subunit